ncbi:MAG: TolC family protein [Bdellovibrionales bacterium]
MRNIQRVALALCAVGMACPAVAGETLLGAVNKAVENHPQVEQVKAQIDAAKAEKSSEKSGFFPELNVNASGGRIYGDNSTTRGLTVSRGAAYSNYWEGGATARQPIFDGFEALSRTRSADRGIKSADMALLDVREQLTLRTVQTYLNVLQSRKALAMLREQQKKMDDYVGRISSMVEQGGADEAELQQAKDVKLLLEGFVNDYEGQNEIAQSQYFELTGDLPDAEMQSPEINPDLEPMDLDAAITQALGRHPLLKSAEFTSQSVEQDIEAEKAALYPDLDGELSYLQSDKREEIGGEVTDARALLRLNWNFETGGGQFARIRQRKEEHREALAREEEVRKQIDRDIRLAYAEYDLAKQRLKNQKKRCDLNLKLFKTYETQFEGGAVSVLQLMQSDNQVFNTKLQHELSRYALLNAQYNVLAAMGRLYAGLHDGQALQDEAQDLSEGVSETVAMKEEESKEEVGQKGLYNYGAIKGDDE